MILIGIPDVDGALEGDALPAQRVRQRVLEAAGVQIPCIDRRSEPNQRKCER